ERLDGRRGVVDGQQDRVVVVRAAHTRLEREPPVPVLRGHDGVAQPLGRTRQLRAGRQTDRLLDLRRRLARQPEHAERQAGVEARELLDLWIAPAPAAKGAERTAVVLLAVAEEADVV